MLELAVGGLYPAQQDVEAILAPRFHERSAILDLGIVSSLQTHHRPTNAYQGPDLVHGASKWLSSFRTAML